jgi:hypothetical protein
MNAKTLAAVTLILFGVADILNTLTIIERGGIEVNPIMNYYLSIGNAAFILVKMSLTLVCTYYIYKYSSLFVLLTLDILYFILIIWQNYLILWGN